MTACVSVRHRTSSVASASDLSRVLKVGTTSLQHPQRTRIHAGVIFRRDPHNLARMIPMHDIDTWRRHEAEERHEMQQYECAACHHAVDDCDAWECPGCHEYYCADCMTGIPGRRLCGECMEKEDACNEVDEVDEMERSM